MRIWKTDLTHLWLCGVPLLLSCIDTRILLSAPREREAREAREALRGVECTDEVSDVIAKTVDKHVAALEEEMRKQFEQRENELLKKIQDLQAAAK